MFNTIEYFHQACQNIIDNKNQKALNYAVNYARQGLEMSGILSARVQALYILNNIRYWRGPIAKESRNILKNFVIATK